MPPLNRRAVLAGSLAVASLATSQASLAQQPAAKLPVVASFSILGDFVRQVGGERVDVAVLVGTDADTHVYQPSATDARRLTTARLIVVNGLGFEGWIDRLVKASGTKASIVVATKGITPLRLEAHDHDHGQPAARKAASEPAPDPHAWQNVAHALRYVATISEALAAADPEGAALYRTNAARYSAELTALDADIKRAIASIPQGRRRIITSHDAFSYFGNAYGLDFIAPQGVSTEAEASAKDVARIIRQIRAEKVPAIFVENISDPRLSERITRETGAKMGGRLWSDALSAPGGPAGTYIDMMRNNIRELSSALAS